MKGNEFRKWLDRKGFTTHTFVMATPGISYGAATKWASSKGRPKRIHEGSRLVIEKFHPDCPLAKIK